MTLFQVFRAKKNHLGRFDLTLNKRKGFVKLAMKHGADLVPIFSFGENDLYYQVETAPDGFWRRVQYAVKQYAGIPPMLFRGRGIFLYSFGLLPYRHPIDVVSECLSLHCRGKKRKYNRGEL